MGLERSMRAWFRDGERAAAVLADTGTTRNEPAGVKSPAEFAASPLPSESGAALRTRPPSLRASEPPSLRASEPPSLVAHRSPLYTAKRRLRRLFTPRSPSMPRSPFTTPTPRSHTQSEARSPAKRVEAFGTKAPTTQRAQKKGVSESVETPHPAPSELGVLRF